MDSKARPPAWQSILAFAIVYLVWGTTFLAIRIGVAEVPPFLLAAMRFLVSGVVIFGWMLVRSERSPSGRQWLPVLLLAVLIFVIDYGFVFWAEQRVPSGVAAVIMATTPVFMSISEITILRTRRLTRRLALALLIGLGGVAALTSHSMAAGGASVDRAGAVALIVASISWSVAAVLTRKLTLPESKVMSSGSQMLAGGVLLTVTAAALGEFRQFHPAAVSLNAWLSLAYLIVAGSIMAFTAYLWLLHHHSVTVVSTHAYVNPVVAVLAGWWLGGEELTMRMMAGTACVLVSVVLIAGASRE